MPWIHYCSYNDLFRLKLISRSMVFIREWRCWSIKRLKIILCEYQLWIPITWCTIIWMIKFCSFKLITFCSFQAPVLKYFIFWSGNATKNLKKAHQNSISLQKSKFFKIFLMITLVHKKQFSKKVSKIAPLRN